MAVRVRRPLTPFLFRFSLSPASSLSVPHLVQVQQGRLQLADRLVPVLDVRQRVHHMPPPLL